MGIDRYIVSEAVVWNEQAYWEWTDPSHYYSVQLSERLLCIRLTIFARSLKIESLQWNIFLFVPVGNICRNYECTAEEMINKSR